MKSYKEITTEAMLLIEEYCLGEFNEKMLEHKLQMLIGNWECDIVNHCTSLIKSSSLRSRELQSGCAFSSITKEPTVT